MPDHDNPTSCEHCATDAHTPAHTEGVCPRCGQKGQKIDTATVKALLAVGLRQVRDVPYRFCPNAACDVVYFSEDGAQTFTTEQVRVRVYQKEPQADDVFVCYCFRHTRGEIRAEWQRSGTAPALDDITAGIQAGQCACDWRNPQGSCCLGNVRALVAELTAAPKA